MTARRHLTLLCVFPMLLPAAEVRVRLFCLHPPAEVRIGGRLYRGDRPESARIVGPLTLDVAGAPRLPVEGPLEIRTEDGRVLLTLRMPLEDYVAGVLAGESSVFRSEEALKAMAVAARTYAVHHMGRHRDEGFDFCDTTHCQDLRLAARSERLRAAAEATEAELLWYEGKPADTYYHRHCGGTTEAVERVWPDIHAPYLRQLTDTFCISTGRAEWQSQIRKQDLGGQIAILSRTPSGRVAEMRVASKRMSATAFQLAVGRAQGWDVVRSNFFEIVDHGDRVTLQGHGAGHGVGLCQIGAEQRGEQGHPYRQILAFYYPGTSLGVSAQGFAWTRMNGERVEVYSTEPREDAGAVALADRALREAESRAGFGAAARPRVRIYPTVAAFRDATGEPGWVAASTLGRTIRMQPFGLLRSTGKLEATLLHEMLHVTIESQANPKTPAWFREGLVLYLAGDTAPRAPESGGPEQEMLRSYDSARSRVRALADRYGRNTIMEWLRTGNAELTRQSPATPPPR